MQKKVGKAFVSFINPFVIEKSGRMVMYLYGTVRADYTGIGADPVYEIFDVEIPSEADGTQPLKGCKVWAPLHNVAGIVWEKMDW